MIYVSSSCVNFEKIKHSVEYLVSKGIKNIELSGGTKYYDRINDDLISLKKKYNINFLCHNYFPPPKKNFFVNLASLDNYIYDQSILHIKNCIKFCKIIGSNKFGFHAGFFIDPQIKDNKHFFNKANSIDKKKSIKRFANAYNEIISFNKSYKIDLYIENNINSNLNQSTLGDNIFMLTSFDEYQELKKYINFKILLDTAHLKVSCKTLHLNYFEELHKFKEKTDYLHLSDNNGKVDSNYQLKKNSDIYQFIKSTNFIKNKTVTLEIYKPFPKILETIKLLENIT